MSRTILHSDCNCFYASVELLHHPELWGRPVAVCGNPEARHGIILTAIWSKDGDGTLAGKTALSRPYLPSCQDGLVSEIFKDGSGDIFGIHRQGRALWNR